MRDTTQIVTKVKLAPKVRGANGRLEPGPIPKFYVGQRVYEIGFIGESEIIDSDGWTDDPVYAYAHYRYRVRQRAEPHRVLNVPESSLRTLPEMRRYLRAKQGNV